MKRWLLLFLTVLMLCGCSAQPDTQPTATEPSFAPPATTEPTGYYDPDNSLEEATQGAVRIYPLNRTDCCGIVPMGDSLLMFSGYEVTTLTKLSGNNLYVSAAANLDCGINPESPSVQISEKGVTYYDEVRRELVFLDAELKEVSRISLPGDITGSPALSADRKTLYYCTNDALRAIDLDSGLDRLLREMHYPYQYLNCIHCGDTVLECSVEDEYGNFRLLFVSAETGETLYEMADDITFWTYGASYLALHPDGAYLEILTGAGEETPLQLVWDNMDVYVSPVLRMGGVILSSTSENATRFDYIDLEPGCRTASLELPGEYYPWSIQASQDEQCVWFLYYDQEHDCDTIIRWEPALSPTGDETVYLSERHSAGNPDLEGLAACAETAQVISEKHGVQILIWTDATAYQPWDYTLTAEYQVPLIQRDLELLDQALSSYPDGFLKQAAAGTANGAVRICLVRSITGNSDAQVLSSADGLQYWDDRGDAYISLAAGGFLEENIYHEMCHVIDNRVLSRCSAYDNWNDLNPEGFEYDYDYVANEARDDFTLTEGPDRAFIDLYSMSFPNEDRARIMEYAMMPGNELYFQSDTMQSKLRQLCTGIRKAFGLIKSDETYLWEQYLLEPLK